MNLIFATTWMGLVSIRLVKQVRERQILYNLSYTWNLKTKPKEIKLIQRIDWWLPEVEGSWEVGEMGKGGSKITKIKIKK